MVWNIFFKRKGERVLLGTFTEDGVKTLFELFKEEFGVKEFVEAEGFKKLTTFENELVALRDGVEDEEALTCSFPAATCICGGAPLHGKGI